MQRVITTFKQVTLDHNGVSYVRVDKFKGGVYSNVDHYGCNCTSFHSEQEVKLWIDEVFGE
jgi:hypothetical protein